MTPARLAAAALLAILAAAGAPATAASPTVAATRAAATLTPTLGNRLPLDARFLGSDGYELSLREALGGRPSVVMLASYGCDQLCPLALAAMADALARTGLDPGREFRVVVIGLDPRAGPEFAAQERTALLQRQPQLARPLRLLSGDGPAIAAAAGGLGIGYAIDAASGRSAHPAGAALVTPDGRVAAFLAGIAFDAGSLRAGLAAAAAGRVHPAPQGPLLRCLRGDLSGSAAAALTTVRAAAAGSVTLLLGWLLWLRPRAAARSTRGEPAADAPVSPCGAAADGVPAGGAAAQRPRDDDGRVD